MTRNWGKGRSKAAAKRRRRREERIETAHWADMDKRLLEIGLVDWTAQALFSRDRIRTLTGRG